MEPKTADQIRRLFSPHFIVYNQIAGNDQRALLYRKLHKSVRKNIVILQGEMGIEKKAVLTPLNQFFASSTFLLKSTVTSACSL